MWREYRLALRSHACVAPRRSATGAAEPCRPATPNPRHGVVSQLVQLIATSALLSHHRRCDELVAARAGTGSGHLKLAWSFSSAITYTSALL
eukprot:6184007-Pleurochrysis_carterae.AAC.1